MVRHPSFRRPVFSALSTQNWALPRLFPGLHPSSLISFFNNFSVNRSHSLSGESQ